MEVACYESSLTTQDHPLSNPQPPVWLPGLLRECTPRRIYEESPNSSANCTRVIGNVHGEGGKLSGIHCNSVNFLGRCQTFYFSAAYACADPPSPW